MEEVDQARDVTVWTTVSIVSFDQMLQSLEPPVSPEVQAQMGQVLKVESARVGQAFHEREARELAGTRLAEERKRREMEGNVRRLAQAEEQLGGLAGGSLVGGAFAWLCFCVCVWADFVLNWNVLPWLLAVKPRTVLGVVLAAAPSTPPLILHAVLASLFNVADPWQALKLSVLSPLGRKARHALSVLLLVAIAVLNVYSVWLLADTREIASVIRTGDATTTISQAEKQKIRDTILAVSISVTVDAALFYLLAFHEFWKFRGQRRGRKEVRDLRTRQEALEQEHARLRADLEGKQKAFEDIAAREQAVVGSHFNQGLVRLQLLIERAAPARSAYQTVRDILFLGLDQSVPGAGPDGGGRATARL
ncbi:MAG: hypothetical protein AAB654_09640 [Acidobacteriota bacterium]